MTTEQTRTRENGTEVLLPNNGQERIAAVKRIVGRKQYAKIDGQIVDLASALIISQVYDALSDENKNKYCAFNVGKMAHIAFRFSKERTI